MYCNLLHTVYISNYQSSIEYSQYTFCSWTSFAYSDSDPREYHTWQLDVSIGRKFIFLCNTSRRVKTLLVTCAFVQIILCTCWDNPSTSDRPLEYSLFEVSIFFLLHKVAFHNINKDGECPHVHSKWDSLHAQLTYTVSSANGTEGNGTVVSIIYWHNYTQWHEQIANFHKHDDWWEIYKHLGTFVYTNWL